MTCGIITGCDYRQEWLLSWWWSHYSAHNKFPVTFTDFGMSDLARAWCAERGEVIKIEKGWVCSKDNVDDKTIAYWEGIYGSEIWHSRDGWFMKPNAIAASPYNRSIWLDLDCEVLGPLNPLFEACEHPSGVAIAEESEGLQEMEHERTILFPDEKLYNSGVVVFKKDSPLILKWAEQSFKQSQKFWGDEHLLSRIIYTNKVEINELPSECNWRICRGINMNALIIHWVGLWGKSFIRRHGGYQEFTKTLYEKE